MSKGTILTIVISLATMLPACSPNPGEPALEGTIQAAIQATSSALTQQTLSAVPTKQPTPTATAAPAPTAALAIGSQRTAAVDGMTQLYVPAGEFLMGSPDVDPDVFAHERPQHRPFLGAFWIDRIEITNQMYANCVGEGACSPPRSTASNTRDSYYGNPEYGDYPVVWVDWSQAQDYCGWAGRRLPTEAEWEKAARGDGGQYYPWGNEPLAAANLADFEDVSNSCARANYGACQPYGDTTSVASLPSGASPYGALDMAGNVWEWVADWYSSEYYSHSPADNPTGPAQGSERVLRGGSFAANFTRDLRSAHRYPFDPAQTIYAFGFRCAESQP